MGSDSELVLEESGIGTCQTHKDMMGRTGNSKPHAADYNEAMQKLIKLAIAKFQVCVSTQYTTLKNTTMTSLHGLRSVGPTHATTNIAL